MTDGGDPLEPDEPDEPDQPDRTDPDDLDHITQDGTDRMGAVDTSFGDSLPAPARMGSSPLVFRPSTSTPLEEDDPDSPIPPSALWAMKYRRHLHLLNRGLEEIREVFGQGDRAVYVMDDGRKYCTVARTVGASPDGCTYYLIAQITVARYDQLVNAEVPTEDIFDGARECALCSVFEGGEGASNVALVETFDDPDDVPLDYLPPSPPMAFSEGFEGED